MTALNRQTFINARQFRGLNNVDVPERLSLRWAERADNVELDDRQTYWKRRGRTQVLSGDYTTAFVDRTTTRFYAQKGSALYRITADMSEYELAPLDSPAPLRACQLNHTIYATNGTDRLAITADSVREWGLPIPAQPGVRKVAGSLPAGQYMVTATFVAPDGRESGAAPITVVDLEDQSSILFQNIDQLAGTETALYASTHDGGVLYRVATTKDVAAQWDGLEAGLGHTLRTQGLFPPPPGQVAEAHSGKVFVGQYVPELDQSAVWMSEPLSPELFDLARGYFQVAGEVRTLLSSPNGVIVATDRWVHLYTNDDQLVDVFDYGVPAGVAGATTKEGRPVLWTYHGMATTGEGGLIVNSTDDVLIPQHGVGNDDVSVAVVDQDGYDKAVVVSEGADQG